MKALVYNGPYDIKFIDVDKPNPGSGEVCIQVKAVSICGSDLYGYKGKSKFRVPPLIMGHELSGDLVEVGTAVESLLVGQRVTVNPNLYCGECHNCLENHTNLCDNRKTVGTKMPAGKYDGGMAEFVCVPARAVIPLPDNISYDEAALLEPLAVSLHAVKLGKKIQGATVAVIGAGPIGLLAIQCAKSLGARAIIAVDFIERRLEKAKQYGTDVIINLKKDKLTLVKDFTKGLGVDTVIDAVGLTESINQGIQIVRNGGNIVVIGLASSVVNFHLGEVVCREIHVQGSYIYQTNEIEEGINMVVNGEVNLKDMITTVASFQEGSEVFARLASDNVIDIKAVIHPV